LLDLYRRAKDLAEKGWNEYGDERLLKDRCSARPYLGRPDLELHSKLGRRPWQYDVLDVDLDNPDVDEPEPRNDQGDWAGAVAARQALEAALVRI
jgi:hypothetical protein